MSSYYKSRIADLEASRLKLITDIADLRAENDKLKARIKRVKSRADALVYALKQPANAQEDRAKKISPTE